MNIMRNLAVTFTVSMFAYTSHQIVRHAPMETGLKALIVGAFAVMYTIVALTFIYLGREKHPKHRPLRDKMMNISLTLMAYINFMVTLVLLRDAYALVMYLLSSGPPENLYGSEAAALLIFIPAAFVILGHIVVRVGPRLVQIPVKFANLHPDLEGLRILHITDLHISPSLPSDFVRKLVHQAHKTNPDIVVFTGDILDSFVEKHSHEFAYLRELKAKHGVYLVTGNHEYYWSAPKAIESFRDAGFQVLINSVANLNFGNALLQIAGIPDPAAEHFRQEGPNFGEIQNKLSEESFKVMLSHQPKLADQSREIGIDLQLSGHTHGGQFFPWNILIRFLQRYSKGLYTLGNMRLYVNQGTGYWGPRLRLGTYCELAEIVLRKG